VASIKADYPQIRARNRVAHAGTPTPRPPVGKALEVPEGTRRAEFTQRWEAGGTTFMTTFTDTIRDAAANEVSAEFVRERIREIVRDPATAELLTPRDYPIGTKRICLGLLVHGRQRAGQAAGVHAVRRRHGAIP
jgi:cyclohexanone monooxygenase